LQALLWNSTVLDEQISVAVSSGCVRLSGDVDSGYEADAAYETVADLIGVVDVTTDIRVTSAAREAHHLIDRVSDALGADRRSAGEESSSVPGEARSRSRERCPRSSTTTRRSPQCGRCPASCP
jgi:hypothetical protein